MKVVFPDESDYIRVSSRLLTSAFPETSGSALSGFHLLGTPSSVSNINILVWVEGDSLVGFHILNEIVGKKRKSILFGVIFRNQSLALVRIQGVSADLSWNLKNVPLS
jgi:predicted Abi (CAAX) family protease